MNEVVTKQFLRDELNRELTRELSRTEKKLRAEFRMDMEEIIDRKLETKVEEVVSRYTGIILEEFQSLLKGVVEVGTDHRRHIDRLEERIEHDIEPRLNHLELVVA